MMLQIWPDEVVHFTPVRVAHNVPESLAHYAPVEVAHFTPVCSLYPFAVLPNRMNLVQVVHQHES